MEKELCRYEPGSCECLAWPCNGTLSCDGLDEFERPTGSEIYHEHPLMTGDRVGLKRPRIIFANGVAQQAFKSLEAADPISLCTDDPKVRKVRKVPKDLEATLQARDPKVNQVAVLPAQAYEVNGKLYKDLNKAKQAAAEETFLNWYESYTENQLCGRYEGSSIYAEDILAWIKENKRVLANLLKTMV